MVADPAPVVVVVDEAGLVVVVEALPFSVVLVVPEVDVVVGAVVVVVVGGVVVVVVVVVDCWLSKGRRIVGPVPAFPKMSASGLPEISSTAVMNPSESKKTTPIAAATAFQLSPRAVPGRARPGGRVGTEEVARRRSAAGALVAAVISRRCVSLVASAPAAMATVSCPPVAGAEPVRSGDAVAPTGPVAPSRRNRGVDSGACTTCRTAAWPRSIDCDTSAVAVVATAAPMATPTMVPVTPKLDAMSAAITAPSDEARIWRSENLARGRARRPGRAHAYSPTAPSIASRRRSAWPL